MAFPDIPTGGRVVVSTTTGTTSPRTFPNLNTLTKSAGDLLIAIIYCYQTTAAGGSIFGSWGASFTEFVDVGGSTNACIGAAYKFSTGSETGTFTVTQAATITGHAAFILLSISGAHASTPPEATGITQGTTSAANPGALAPSWGAEDTLWISVAGNGETGTGGTFNGLGSSPTNYGGDVETAISSDVVGGVTAGVGFRQNNTASEDVGTWTLDTSNARNSAVVIAVRPKPPVPPVVKDLRVYDLSAVGRASVW